MKNIVASIIISVCLPASGFAQIPAQTVHPFPEDTIGAPDREEDAHPLRASYQRHTSVLQGAPMHHRITVFLTQFEIQGGLARNIDLSDQDFDRLAAFALREKFESHRASNQVKSEACRDHVLGRSAVSIDAVSMSTALSEGFARNHMAKEQRFAQLLTQLSTDARDQISTALMFFDNSRFSDRNYPAIVSEHPEHYARHFQELCSRPPAPLRPPVIDSTPIGRITNESDTP